MKSLRGIFPAPREPPKRNFVKENVKTVKQKSANNLHKLSYSLETNVNKRNDVQPLTNNKSAASSKKEMPRSRSLSNARKVAQYHGSSNYSLNRHTSTEEVRPQSRDVSSQTERTDNELFLKDVIIRLPSATVMDKLKKAESINELQLHLKNADEESTNIDYLENPTIRTVHSVEKLTEIDDHSNHYMKTSITRTFNRTNSHSNIDDSTKNQQSNLNIEIKNCQHFQRHPPDTDLKNKLTLPTSYRLGEVPKYLKELKEKTAEKERLKSLINTNCPAGHIELSDAERTDTLDIAQKKHQSLIDELNKMSITSTTLRTKQRRIEIERMLNKLDETIQIFSRPTVYVKIN